MHRSIEFRLKLATILLTLVGYFGLTSTFRYGPSLLFIPLAGIAFMPIGEWLDARYTVYRRITTGIIIVYAFVFVMIAREASLLDAVISLVIFIQLYSLAHLKTARNYAYIFLMAFFLLLAAAVNQPRAGIALVFLFFVIGMAWALTLLEMYVAAGPRDDSRGEGVRLRVRGGETALQRVEAFGHRFAGLLALFVVSVLGVSAVLFVLAPRTEAGILGASEAPRQFTTGVSTEVDLSTGGVLESDTSPVMRVQFPEQPGGQYGGAKLWRTTTLDAYTGTSWTHRGLRTQGSMEDLETRRFRSDYRVASREGLERPSFERGRLVYQEIFLDRVPETGVPVLQIVKTLVPVTDDVAFRWDIAGDFTVQMSSEQETGIDLRAWSEVISPRPEDLRSAGTDYRRIMAASDYRNLTYQNLLPETLQLVERVTANAPTAYDKVVALERYLSTAEFLYTREIPDLPERQPVDVFILEEKQGHCQLFASALALMVRSQGIPARLVSGYRGGLWDASDQSYTVTNDMAHIWTEVYFPGIGWVSFDPSPRAAEPEGFSLESLRRNYARYLLKARMLWLRRVVAFQPEEDGVILRNVAIRTFRTIGNVWETFTFDETEVSLTRSFRGPLLGLGVIVGMAGLAVFALRIAGGRRRSRRGALTPDQKRAVRLHRQIKRRFRQLGIECEGKTAEELAASVESVGVNEPAVAHEVLELYNAVRFGDRAFSDDAFAAWRRKIRVLKPVAEP